MMSPIEFAVKMDSTVRTSLNVALQHKKYFVFVAACDDEHI